MKVIHLLPVVVVCMIVANSCKTGNKEFTKLVWSDEFDNSGKPDSSKWNYELGFIRNNEMQYYTNRLENARVENGILIIEARQESSIIGKDTIRVSSASLKTAGKHDWKYGRIEVRAKIPSFLGSWPAIWMLGSNVSEAGWPRCGEIDMMENVGYMPDTMHFNIHTEAYNHVKGTNKGNKVYLKDPAADFHIYAVEWHKDKLDFYLDSAKVFTFMNEGKGTEVWPFDKPQYLILNLAVGGSWGGSHGVDQNALPQKFLIDYVRVYQ
jgi:beta-glucanase (GH16 family)